MLLEQRRQQFSGVALIVDDEDTQSVDGRFRQVSHRLTLRQSERRFREPGRQSNDKRRTLIESIAMRLHVAAVLFDQVAGDGETQSKAAVPAGGAAVGLPEAIEDERQEVRRNAGSRIANRQPHPFAISHALRRDPGRLQV